MIVTCESCKTKFRLDPTRFKGASSKVRCSRCGNTFSVDLPDDEDEVLIHVDLSEESLMRDEEDAGSRPVPSPRQLPKPARRGLLRSVLLWAVPLLLLCGGLFWFINHKDTLAPPDIPASGKKAEAEAKPPLVTILDTTQAYFLENAHAGQIFVVEGEVANESGSAVSFILLEGKLYTKDGRVAQSQRCFPGNVMTRDELNRLGVAEIQDKMMNREGKDLSNVHVSAQKRIPFMLVFHNLPEMDALSDYSVEVISAKAD